MLRCAENSLFCIELWCDWLEICMKIEKHCSNQISTFHSKCNAHMEMEMEVEFETSMFIVLNISFCACLFCGQGIYSFKNSLSTCRNSLEQRKNADSFSLFVFGSVSKRRKLLFSSEKCIELFNFISKMTNKFKLVYLSWIPLRHWVSMQLQTYEYLVSFSSESLRIPAK